MRSIPPSDLAQLLEGHVDARVRAGALQPLRLPAGELAFYDPFTRWVATATSGVRLRCITDTRSFTLEVTQRTAMAGPDGARVSNYDLFVDGTLQTRKPAEGGAVLALDGNLIGDERARLTFNDLPAGEKHIELWLPQAATVSIVSLSIDDGAQLRAWPDTRLRVIFHGSSITHCMEAEGPSGAWPAVASALAGRRHLNLGWGGSCLLSGLAARIIRDQDAQAIVLKLGINVWSEGMLKERTFRDSAHAMISIIREKHQATPLVIVSPIHSPTREEHGEQNGLSLTRMRAILEEVVQARVRAGDAHIRYLSGLALFDEHDVDDLPDGLHPNGNGYRHMGERFHAWAKEIGFLGA